MNGTAPTGGEEVRLSVILVNYNTRDDILEALRSLREYPPSHAHETIVVDNASTDGSPEEIERLFPEVRRIENAENVGYSRGVNQGIRASRGEFFLVLNPDVRVTEGSLDRLLEYAMEHPEVGIAGPKLLNPDGTLQHSCRTFYTWKTFLYRRTPLGRLRPDSPVIRRHLMLDWDHRSVRDVDWMLGAGLLVRRSAVEDVGAMDERFFLYFEDVDWCYRMKAQGWRVVYVADAEMIHAHRRDSARRLWSRQTRSHLGSMFRFYDKWSHAVYRWKARRHWARFILSLGMDAAMINLAFLTAYGLRRLVEAFFPSKPVWALGAYGVFLVFVNLITLLSLGTSGFYRERVAPAGPGPVVDRIVCALRAVGIAYLVVTAATFLTQAHIYSRILVTIFFVLLVFFLVLGRSLLDRLHADLRRGAYDLGRAVVVGTNDLAAGLADQLRTFRELGYDLVGFVREDGEETGGRRVLGGVDELPRIVRDHRITDVFYAGVGDPLPLVTRLLLRLPDAPVTVRVLSDLESMTIARGRAEAFLNLPVLRFERRLLIRLRPGRKRLFDFLLGVVLLIAGAIPAALITLAALIGGARPVFRREERVHFRGVRERLLLFRVPSPGETAGAARALGSLYGRFPFLAAYPALGAVLAGRFSFVGPFPEEPEAGRFLDEWQRLLVTMKPGIVPVTARADHSWVPFRDPVGLNLYYLQYWSIGFDLQILLHRLFRSAPASEETAP
ncbi:MAG: glycosyltransferase [Candidatus Eisenbacteria bacterium]|nr:glycosyltransferase [Candidatus Eisenbacteria bacterium]